MQIGRIIIKRPLVGWFTLLELAGWPMFIFGWYSNPFFSIIGLVLLIAGSSLSKTRICSECGNKVEKTSRICPACRVQLS